MKLLKYHTLLLKYYQEKFQKKDKDIKYNIKDIWKKKLEYLNGIQDILHLKIVVYNIIIEIKLEELLN